jgi:hypothetical protein
MSSNGTSVRLIVKTKKSEIVPKIPLTHLPHEMPVIISTAKRFSGNRFKEQQEQNKIKETEVQTDVQTEVQTEVQTGELTDGEIKIIQIFDDEAKRRDECFILNSVNK